MTLNCTTRNAAIPVSEGLTPSDSQTGANEAPDDNTPT